MNKPRFITLLVLLIVAILIGLGAAWLRYSKEISFISLIDPVQREIEESIAEYDFSNPDYSVTVDNIKALGQEAIPKLAKMTDDPKKKTRYIVFISLSGLAYQLPDKQAEILPHLKKGLTDPDPTVKVQVAQILSLFGENQSLPVLIEALDSQEMMIPSEPILLLRDYAYYILIENTDQNFEYDKDQWKTWWDENEETLEFDTETKKFKTI